MYRQNLKPRPLHFHQHYQCAVAPKSEYIAPSTTVMLVEPNVVITGEVTSLITLTVRTAVELFNARSVAEYVTL